MFSTAAVMAVSDFKTGAEQMRRCIATWNVNSIRARLQHLQQWLRLSEPGLVAIQETKTQDDDFPLDAITELGYQAVFAGQKTPGRAAAMGSSRAGSPTSTISRRAG